jgi:hypothetical protein
VSEHVSTAGARGSGQRTTVVNRRRAQFDVYIGRPSKWGNPFSHKEGTLAQFRVATRAECIAAYERWIRAQPELMEAARRELRGKVLGCWCKPAACHGDVLAAIADGSAAQSRELLLGFESSSQGGQ